MSGTGSSLRRSAELGLALGVALLLASPARADEPLAPERDTNPAVLPPPSTRPNLILIGAALTAGWYGAAYGTSYLWPDSPSAESLRLPVAGPYLALAKTGCGDREAGCETFGVVLRTLLTGLSAVGQTGGVLAMLEGVFVVTGSPAPARAGTSHPERERRAARADHAAVAVIPAPVGESGYGLGVLGHF